MKFYLQLSLGKDLTLIQVMEMIEDQVIIGMLTMMKIITVWGQLDGMALIIVKITKKAKIVMFAAICKKGHLLHPFISRQNMPYMVIWSIGQQVKRQN